MNVAQLPKADLHLHAETDGRVERILARREGRPAFDWVTWATHLQRETPPGFARLETWRAHQVLPTELVESLDARSEVFVERVADAIRESAADGAILVEVRFGSATSFRSDFMPLFREAELRAQRDFPGCHAEAIISGLTPGRPDRWREPGTVFNQVARRFFTLGSIELNRLRVCGAFRRRPEFIGVGSAEGL